MPIPTVLRPLLLSVGLAAVPAALLAQATPPPTEAPVPRPLPPSLAPPAAADEAALQAQAQVLLLSRRVDSRRVAYRQQQHLYGDLGGRFSSFLAGQKLTQATRFSLAKSNVRATAALLQVCHSRLTQLRTLTQALRNANEQATLASPTSSNPLGISLVDFTKHLATSKALDKNKGRRLIDLATHLTQNSFVKTVPTVGPMISAVGELITSVRASSLSADGFSTEQVKLVEDGLRPTLTFFAALDAARADNQAALLTLDNELIVLEHQLSQLYRPYAQLVAYQDDISSYYFAPPAGQPATAALDVANVARLSTYVATGLDFRFAALDRDFNREKNQADILDPASYLTPANNSAEAAVQLATQLQSLTDRLPLVTTQYSQAIRAAIAQGQQDNLIKPERAAQVIAAEARRNQEVAETYQQARAAERFSDIQASVKPLFKLY